MVLNKKKGVFIPSLFKGLLQMIDGTAVVTVEWDRVQTLPIWQKAIGDHLLTRHRELLSFWLVANACDGM